MSDCKHYERVCIELVDLGDSYQSVWACINCGYHTIDDPRPWAPEILAERGLLA